ncbi:HNH endonuclease [Delftia sp. GW456-R20]|uniref:HNH endonuclease n=1 Tax=Delftia sp. GW456-R20 TaxID=1827145 RepID=UPI0007AEDDFC|nr:HNH endonuclease [Delftia sp. GW456-R20]
MATEDRFKQAVIATLARRSANQCANPDCGALTSGPSENPHDSVNLGEAAHIYGANPGSARYEPTMTSVDRSSITNAIWLCGNCHKLIDDDPAKYPSGLLFEWQRAHEQFIAEKVGKTSALIRKKFEDRHLEEFGRLSYLSERLILEKGDLWEYRLTAEVLRFEMEPVQHRWNALKRNLYTLPGTRVTKEDFFPWIGLKLKEIRNISHSFVEISNNEFAIAWGAPGVPGKDTAIVATARLYSEMCQSALKWEESIRFAFLDRIFEELQNLLIGTAGRIIDEAAKLPAFFAETLGKNPVKGRFELILALNLSEGWGDEVNAALERIRIQLSE